MRIVPNEKCVSFGVQLPLTEAELLYNLLTADANSGFFSGHAGESWAAEYHCLESLRASLADMIRLATSSKTND